MKYSQSSSKFSGNAAFYIIIAVCLLIIGGASWFALSNYNKSVADNTDKSNMNSKGSAINEEEYKDKTSSYTQSTPSADLPYANEVSQSVSDEPYSPETENKVTVFTMPVEGEILKTYSTNELQFSATYDDMRLHTGIDISCEDGTAVSACSDGTVISVEESANFGPTVTIEHGNGITVKYSALKDITVKPNQKVTAGDIIGKITTVPCECADQSHLHLEVLLIGTLSDPRDTLKLK